MTALALRFVEHRMTETTLVQIRKYVVKTG